MPNLVIDGLMPKLRDTELRVLLVLIRQTAGWNRPGSTVTVPYRKLTLLTGRQNEAVSSALRSLSELGLIHTRVRASRRFPKPSASESERQQTKTD